MLYIIFTIMDTKTSTWKTGFDLIINVILGMVFILQLSFEILCPMTVCFIMFEAISNTFYIFKMQFFDYIPSRSILLAIKLESVMIQILYCTLIVSVGVSFLKMWYQVVTKPRINEIGNWLYHYLNTVEK